MKKLLNWKKGQKFPDSEQTVMTLGKFDGIHLGHQKLLRLAKERAEETGEKLAVFTFSNSASAPMTPIASKLLTTEEERQWIFESRGTDYLIEAYFDETIKRMEPEQFVEAICSDFHVTDFFIGPDFRFGYQRRGEVSLLRHLGERYGYQVHEIPKEQLYEEKISSSRIRACIAEHRMREAEELLGHPYFVDGLVVYGQQLGRTIDIPTANLLPAVGKLLPPNGAYLSKVELEDGTQFYGMTNIGCRPSVSEGKHLSIETNLFDFSGNLYGKHLRVMLLDFLRNEQRFSSVEKLKEQIEQDKIEAKRRIKDGSVKKRMAGAEKR